MVLALGQSLRLPLERPATEVVVADPEIADVQLTSPSMLYVIGKSAGTTSLSVQSESEDEAEEGGAEERIDDRIVLVVLDLDPLQAILAGEPGLEEVRARHLVRGVSLDGEVPSAEAAARAIRLAATVLPEGVPLENALRIVTPQQVNLEVQIAEVSRRVAEQLGVRWEFFGNNDAEAASGAFSIGRPDLVDDQGALLKAPGFEAGGTFFFESAGMLGSAAVSHRIMIDALAEAGLANVLARPNVTAVSGETASFFSGGEYPLRTVDKDGGSIEYKKYGVLLNFVPTVVDADRIVLTVRPEVSDLSAVATPDGHRIFNVRRAETTVEVGDGESIVIAGLFSTKSNTSEDGVPGMKDLPVLGRLFGSTTMQSDELELIVIVTARLVRAGATDGTEAPTPRTSLRVAGYHY